MNRNFYKKMKNYKEIKGFIQNEYICIANILPIWNDIRIADITKLCEIQSLRLGLSIRGSKCNLLSIQLRKFININLNIEQMFYRYCNIATSNLETNGNEL